MHVMYSYLALVVSQFFNVLFVLCFISLFLPPSTLNELNYNILLLKVLLKTAQCNLHKGNTALPSPNIHEISFTAAVEGQKELSHFDALKQKMYLEGLAALKGLLHSAAVTGSELWLMFSAQHVATLNLHVYYTKCQKKVTDIGCCTYFHVFIFCNVFTQPLDVKLHK